MSAAARTFHHVTLKKRRSKTREGTQILSSTRNVTPEQKMPPKSRCHASFPLFYKLAAVFVWLTCVSRHKGQSSLTRGRRISFISAYYRALIVCDNNVTLAGGNGTTASQFHPVIVWSREKHSLSDSSTNLGASIAEMKAASVKGINGGRSPSPAGVNQRLATRSQLMKHNSRQAFHSHTYCQLSVS